MNRYRNIPRGKGNIFYGFALIISIISILFVGFTNELEEYRFLFLLPLFYLIMIITFNRIFLYPRYNYGIIFYIAHTCILIRYVIMPISIIIDPYTSLYGPDPSIIDMNVAYFLMIYELTWIFITYCMSGYMRIKGNDKVAHHSLLNHNELVFIILAVMFSILIFYPNSIIPKNLFVIDESYSKVTFDASLDGLISIISIVFRCLAFLFILSIIQRRDQGKEKILNFVVAMLILVFYIGLFTGTSRITMLIMATIGVYLIIKMFPNYSKMALGVTSMILMVSIVSVSLYKFSWLTKDSTAPVADIIKVMSGQFQAYFSGPRLVAQSLSIKEAYGDTLSYQTLINDFAGSIPYISKYINQSDRINIYFNRYNYMTTTSPLIMPLIGIGYSYFGMFLAPIFTMICEWFVIKIDYKISCKENRLEFIFTYMYLGIRLSFCTGHNTQSLFYSFITPVLPLLIILYLNTKIIAKRKPKYERLRMLRC